MSELDVKTLKRQVDAQRNTAFMRGVRLELPLDQVNAIIAALEDCDRLRAAMASPPWRTAMAELNYSLIQEAVQRLEGDGLYLPAQAIIAALEDRDRLRATVSRIDAVVERMYLPPEFAHFQAELSRILTLEGRDG